MMTNFAYKHYNMPLNLHMFEMQVTTRPDLSPEMKTFYVKELIENMEPRLVHDQFGKEQNVPKGSGKTFEVRRFGVYDKALTPLTEGVVPVPTNTKVTALTAELFQYGAYSSVSDILDLTAIDPFILEVTKAHGSQAGRTLDTITREVVQGGTNVYYAPQIVAGVETPVTSRAALDMNCKLTPDLFFRAQAALETANTEKIGDNYVAIIHPEAAYDIMRHEEWREASLYAGSTQLFRGEIGMIANVRFVSTSEAKIWKDATCPSDGGSGYLAVFGTLVLGADAYAVSSLEGGGLEMIVKNRKEAGGPLEQWSTVGWKSTKAALRLAEERMIRIESLASASVRIDPN